jgi:hypothetical protein
MHAPSPFTYKKQKWEETSSCKKNYLKQIMSNINSETSSQGLQAYCTDFYINQSICITSVQFYSITIWYNTQRTGSTNVPKSRSHQKGDMKQVSHQGTTVLEWLMNLMLIWCLFLDASEMIHILVRNVNNCSNYAKTLVTTTENLVTQASRHPGYVHHWCRITWLLDFIDHLELHFRKWMLPASSEMVGKHALSWVSQ